jgi:hypothetical protein
LHTHQVFNHSKKSTKIEEDMGLEQEREVWSHFSKNLKQTINHPRPVFSPLLLHLLLTLKEHL